MRKSKKNEIIGTVIALILFFILIFITNISVNEKSFFKNVVIKLTYPIQKININKEIVNKKEYASLNELEEKIKKLEKENEKLRSEKEVKQILLEDNKKLSEVLNLKNKYDNFETLPVKIKYRSTNNYTDYIIVNAGKNQGIEEDMVVISENGLFGRVEEVYENESKVKSITDPSSKVSINIGKKEENLIAQGSIKSEKTLVVTLLPEELNISIGEPVFTSGIGGIFPKGLFIGNISKANSQGKLTNKEVEIKLLKDFDEVENLLIIKR